MLHPQLVAGGRELYGAPFTRALVPLMGASPSGPRHPPKAPPPTTIPLGVRISACESGGGMTFQTTAAPVPVPLQYPCRVKTRRGSPQRPPECGGGPGAGASERESPLTQVVVESMFLDSILSRSPLIPLDSAVSTQRCGPLVGRSEKCTELLPILCCGCCVPCPRSLQPSAVCAQSPPEHEPPWGYGLDPSTSTQSP